MDELRGSLLLFGTMFTMLGVLIKVINDFFINVIKMKYQNVPGKQSSFSFILQIITYIGVIVGFVSWIISITRNQSNTLNLKPSIIILSLILSFFLFAPIFNAVNLFLNLRTYFIDKLENGKINRMDKKYKKKIRLWRNMSLIIPVISLFILISKLYEDKETLIFWGGYAFFLFICFAILLRLEDIYNSLVKNDIYILKLKDEKVICKLYLEFEEFYLLYEDKHERYIKKSEVSEIRKVIK